MQNNENYYTISGQGILAFWGKVIGVGFFSVLFFLLGIDTLIGSYSLRNPMEFLIYFFASNLMILTSAVGCLYPAARIFRYYRMKKKHD